MEIVHQLSELFLQAVPTVLIVFLFYLFVRTNFFRPMEKILDERRERTVGAQRAAEASQAAAQEKQRAYQEALKRARGEIYAEQELARNKIIEERTTRLRQGRSRAASEVQAAKERIASEVAAARLELDVASVELGREIVRRVLRQAPPQPTSPGREPR
jgi:F0F1-type ATP synthase membrane subunit b/b'